MRQEGYNNSTEWLAQEKRILLHAGGQSRRLPAYAPSGKALTPIPVFRWGKGQRLTQNQLSLQVPLYVQIMEKSPASLHTLIASGDVFVRACEPLQEIPDVDVVCYGLWVNPSLAQNHGVFVMDRQSPEQLDYMLQKPSIEELSHLIQHHFFLLDIGVWVLSDRAVELLMKRSTREGKTSYYDLYCVFGLSLGANPGLHDDELTDLTVAILPLPGGEFYHYGTSREMISSTLAVQNLVTDQRQITLHRIKPHPAMFTQNARIELQLTPQNAELWIENSHVGKGWVLHDQHIITGVPANDWKLNLPQQICIDVIPFGENDFVARPYGFNDTFKGRLDDSNTLFMGRPVNQWLDERSITPEEIEEMHDLQAARIFPVCTHVDELEKVFQWFINDASYQEGEKIWRAARKVSADEISAYANLRRLTAQREAFRNENWVELAKNHERSVFYQLNLQEAAEEYSQNQLPLPPPLPEATPLMTRINHAMFRARTHSLNGYSEQALQEEAHAFALMREGFISQMGRKQSPRLSVYSDQIVWGRSPVRIDLAGGWTDTPPYCLNEGGNVINMAVTLNGQPPLQVYIKPCKEYKIILRSIDLGAMEVINTYDELRQFNIVGSPFSIPKAALVLAGFHPNFSLERFTSLQEQLKVFGAGIEVTLLSAIPAGSGLGTSSILAATMLGATNDFCGLGWDKQEIGNYTLMLEQLLTTGGGWQDQYGGILPGVKLLQTHPAWEQTPLVRWLPGRLFTDSDYKNCHLLYYTGLTRTAKNILSEIVKGMFLNNTSHLELLRQMKHHALDMFEAIQQNDYETMARLVGVSWQQNQRLDSGTNPAAVQAIINQVADLCLGYKLPGAGGGGFLYMAAKDEEAATRIRRILNENPTNEMARFVEMALSEKGLEISRS